MALIKITDKHLNLGLKFEHPIVLNPEKKYKQSVSRLMFSFDKEVKIDVRFDFLYQYQIRKTLLQLQHTLVALTLLIFYEKYFNKNVMLNST